MELLQVFDEKQNALNEYIERDKKREIENNKYYMIILLFIENSKGEFLIQRTSLSKKHVYATTGGHVTYKDSPEETVLKETKEELGINLNLDDIKIIDTIKYPILHCNIYYHKGDYDLDKLKLQEEEVESVYWFSIDKIKELIKNNEFREANIKPFELVLNYINK